MSEDWKRRLSLQMIDAYSAADDEATGMRQALSVALPEILERAATVAEHHIGEWHSDLPATAFVPTGIAAAIRNLKDETCQ